MESYAEVHENGVGPRINCCAHQLMIVCRMNEEALDRAKLKYLETRRNAAAATGT